MESRSGFFSWFNWTQRLKKNAVFFVKRAEAFEEISSEKSTCLGIWYVYQVPSYPSKKFQLEKTMFSMYTTVFEEHTIHTTLGCPRK